jgi:hypothetical protein
MKRTLSLLAILFSLASFGQQNSILNDHNDLVFHAPLDEWNSLPGAALISGSLVVGTVYKVGHFVAGDVFTNVADIGAAANASGAVFVATGTTPTTWTNGSLLRAQNAYQLDLSSLTKGTVTGAYPVVGRNREGRRWYETNSTDYFEFADADRLDVGTADFTMAIKFTPANVTETGKYLLNKEASGIGYGLYQTTNDLYLRLDDGTTDVSAIIGTNVLTAGTSIVAMVTCTRTGNAVLYVNGTSSETIAISTAALTLSNAGVLRIADATAGSATFSGNVSNCYLFNRALSSTEALSYSTAIQNNTFVMPYVCRGATNAAITAGSFVVGKKYRILVPGTTNFTLIGAVNSNAGTEFTATGVGTGDGTAIWIGTTLLLDPSGMYSTIWLDRDHSVSGTVSGATLITPVNSDLSATYFDGVNDKTDYEDRSSFTLPNNGFTFSAWINVNKGQINTILSKNTGASTAEYLFSISSSGAISVILFDSGSNTNSTSYLSATTQISTNTWYNVAFVYNNGVGTCYRNGVALTTTATPTGSGFSTFGNTSAHLTLGIRLASPTTYIFNGVIQDPRIYNRVLLPEEITALYRGMK